MINDVIIVIKNNATYTNRKNYSEMKGVIKGEYIENKRFSYNLLIIKYYNIYKII